jgi:hypothetical protein
VHAAGPQQARRYLQDGVPTACNKRLLLNPLKQHMVMQAQPKPSHTSQTSHLMRPADQVQVVPLQEIRHAVWAKCVAHAAVVLAPALRNSSSSSVRNMKAYTGQSLMSDRQSEVALYPLQWRAVERAACCKDYPSIPSPLPYTELHSTDPSCIQYRMIMQRQPRRYTRRAFQPLCETTSPCRS